MTKIRQSFLIFLLLLTWIYIGWRALFTLPSGLDLIFGLWLLIPEVLLTLQNTLFYIILFKPNNRMPPPLLEGHSYTVDIFIATYNEPFDLVKRTILACKNIDYPKEDLSIWLCDDGNRSPFREMAHSLDIGYITRSSNEHAKAGNLNNALLKTKGDIVVTIDADMIPKPHFLQRTLGYFRNEQVAFVQTPQSFYNEDIYQYNLIQSKNIPNEQDLFMRLIQAGRDRFNSTIYIGSNTLFRRRALESVNGFATGTITEDMATGMLIQAKGYQTVFHNEVLAQGLAAESLSDFLSQRVRWARGTIQTMRKWNPMTLPGLTFMQRLLYISSLIYWYFGVFKLIFILAPILYLVFGISSLHATLTGILIFWLPSFLLSSIVQNILFDKRMKRFWSNIYETSVAPFLAGAVLIETFSKKSVPFKVTPKGITSEKTTINISFAAPHFVLLLLSLIALIIGGNKFSKGLSDGIFINFFWVLYNLIILVPTILLSRERPRQRKTERFRRDLKVEIPTPQDPKNQSLVTSTLDVSETGCRLFTNQLIDLPGHLEILVHGTYSTLTIKGSLVYYDSYKDGFQIGIRFDEMEDALLQLWIKEIYGETPLESLFKFKTKLDVVNVIRHYFRELRIPIKKRVRTSPRIFIHLPCEVVRLPKETVLAFQEGAAAVEAGDNSIGEINNNATLIDFGLNGCKIILDNFQLENGDHIGVHVLGHFFGGQVVRSEQKGKMEIGVFWSENTSWRQLLEVINEQI